MPRLRKMDGHQVEVGFALCCLGQQKTHQKCAKIFFQGAVPIKIINTKCCGLALSWNMKILYGKNREVGKKCRQWRRHRQAADKETLWIVFKKRSFENFCWLTVLFYQRYKSIKFPLASFIKGSRQNGFGLSSGFRALSRPVGPPRPLREKRPKKVAKTKPRFNRQEARRGHNRL